MKSVQKLSYILYRAGVLSTAKDFSLKKNTLFLWLLLGIILLNIEQIPGWFEELYKKYDSSQWFPVGVREEAIQRICFFLKEKSLNSSEMYQSAPWLHDALHQIWSGWLPPIVSCIPFHHSYKTWLLLWE